MSQTTVASVGVKSVNPNDPRRDKNVHFYDRENIAKMTSDGGGGISELYQLVSMFVGIYAFMMKVRI